MSIAELFKNPIWALGPTYRQAEAAKAAFPGRATA